MWRGMNLASCKLRMVWTYALQSSIGNCGRFHNAGRDSLEKTKSGKGDRKGIGNSRDREMVEGGNPGRILEDIKEKHVCLCIGNCEHVQKMEEGFCFIYSKCSPMYSFIEG